MGNKEKISGPANFEKPWTGFDRVDLTFPSNTLRLMPSWDDCKNHHKYDSLFNSWFFSGLSKLKGIPREGINVDEAMVHIRMVIDQRKKTPAFRRGMNCAT
jgi:hypothetical protein